jgi:ABC-type sugar transport system ATPase subunit
MKQDRNHPNARKLGDADRAPVQSIEARLTAVGGTTSIGTASMHPHGGTSIAPALEWRNVSVDLGEFAVDDVSLRADPGSWICIVGPTGAGKTLLLEAAAGFLAPTSGSVFRDGIDITRQPPERRSIAYAPQDDLLFPHLDVHSNLTFGSARTRSREPRPERLASELGISHLLRRKIDAISGGEAQRVALGRALLLDAEVLLLDECTSALDDETRRIVGRLLQAERRRRNLCIVQVTHDSSEARRLADTIVTMQRGKVVEVQRRSRATPDEGRLISMEMGRR